MKWRRAAWLRRWATRHPWQTLSIALALGIAALCFGAARWVPDPLAQDFAHILQPPSAVHWLGTDQLGRDVWARVLHAGQLSLSLALAGTLGTGLIGVIIGLMTALTGRTGEQFLLRATDVGLALPGLVIAGALAGLFGPGEPTLMGALILSGWPGVARLTWAVALTERQRDSALAAEALGATIRHLARVHLLPSLIGPLSAQLALTTSHLLLSVASYSFLGLGIQPPTPEWGGMLSEARAMFLTAPYLLVAPGVMLTLTAAGLNALSELVEDASRPGSS